MLGGIVAGLLYSNASEWLVHKYLLHGLGRKKDSFYAFHWHEHHKRARKSEMRDEDYERSPFGTHAQGKEVYRDVQKVQDDQIPLFSGEIAVEVVEPLVEAKKDQAALKGLKLADADIIHTSMLVDLGYIDRKLTRAILVEGLRQLAFHADQIAGQRDLPGVAGECVRGSDVLCRSIPGQLAVDPARHAVLA